jgi:hypothetical protein
MKTKRFNSKNLYLLIGLILVVVTFALNERIIAEIVPSYRASSSAETKYVVFVIDVIFALALIFLLVRRQPRAKILIDSAVGIGLALVLLAGVELAFYYLNLENNRQLENVVFDFVSDSTKPDVRFDGEHAQALFQRDDWLGYRPVPDMRVVASRENGDEVFYTATYSIDDYGRRVTPLEPPADRSEFILFFGGSYTFGEGVSDHETMPYYVSSLASNYRSYNYGVGGYGPQQLLAQLQRDSVTQGIGERQGILIYTFISEHVDRAIGSMLIHNQRGDVMPYYFLDASGALVRKGDLVSGRPLLSLLYWIAGRSQTLKYFNINLPPQLRPRDLQITVKMIDKARQLFREKFKSDKFYVLIYPGRGNPELLPYLEAAEIEVLNYAEIPEIYDDGFWLGEGHPTARGHQIVAEMLVRDLKLRPESVDLQAKLHAEH